MEKSCWIDKEGYVIKDIRINGVRKHKRLHRLVMERYLGRELERDEIIHHIDHNRQNNYITNLEVVKGHREHKLRFHPKAWNKGKITILDYVCQRCGKPFKAIRQYSRKFCSKTCVAYHNLEILNGEIYSKTR